MTHSGLALEGIARNVFSDGEPLVGGVFVSRTGAGQLHANTLGDVLDTLVPDVGIEHGVNEDLLGAHLSVGDLLDHLDGLGSTRSVGAGYRSQNLGGIEK